MSSTNSKPIRSPSYPNMPLREAVAAVGKIDAQYRASPVDRIEAAKLIGFSSLSGPANMALAALAGYGLVERAGKGEMRVSERARSILHPDSQEEKSRALQAAASEPQLYRDLRERFSDIAVPPEEGVVTYLNRQGFNPSAVRLAARAFRQTMAYMEELGATDSHGPKPISARELQSPMGEGSMGFGGASVGDLIQWESDGVLRLEKPLRVRLVTEDGKWVAVEGSETGIPMDQVIVEERAAQSRTPPSEAPRFSLNPGPDRGVDETVAGTDLRFQLGKGVVVQVRSKEELDAGSLDKLLKLLTAQRDALLDN